MSDKIAAAKAALALLEAEEAFKAKKAAGELTTEDKLALRALREEFRSNTRTPVKDGAAPAPIGAKAEVS
jgi:hypothetical protein